MVFHAFHRCRVKRLHVVDSRFPPVDSHTQRSAVNRLDFAVRQIDRNLRNLHVAEQIHSVGRQRGLFLRWNKQFAVAFVNHCRPFYFHFRQRNALRKRIRNYGIFRSLCKNTQTHLKDRQAH